MASLQSFTLYWSSFDKFERCPQLFLWSKGWGTLDVGGGPGEPKPVPLEKSRHHAVMGIVIQGAVERLVEDELWKNPGVREKLLALARSEFDLEIARGGVDEREMSREDMWVVIEAGIVGWLRTMKEHKLLGPYTKAELDMVAYVDKYTPIGGRADLVIRRDDTGITIIDGKNSKRYKNQKTGKFIIYTDPDQLRWYALCFYLAYRRMPDRLGFVYYRYPHGDPKLDVDGTDTGEIEPGVDWVPFTKDDLKGLARRAKDAFRAIRQEKFEAKPEPSRCKFCDYETVCPQRQAQKQANRRTPKNTEAFFDGMTGIQTFGFGADGGPTVLMEKE